MFRTEEQSYKVLKEVRVGGGIKQYVQFEDGAYDTIFTETDEELDKWYTAIQEETLERERQLQQRQRQIARAPMPEPLTPEDYIQIVVQETPDNHELLQYVIDIYQLEGGE